MRSSLSRLLAPLCVLALTATTTTGQDCVIPPTPLPVDAVQPDGMPILLRLRGTGLHDWLEDLDGHPVLRVVDGRGGHAFVFATQDAEGRLQATPLLVGRADPTRAGIPRGIVPTAPAPPTGPDVATPGQKGLPGTSSGLGASSTGGKVSALTGVGTVDNLVVLLRFSNHGPSGQNRTLPSDGDVWKIMNEVGGDPVLAPTGSVRDHYLETSYGQLTIDSTIVFWVDVPNAEYWYANGNSGLTTRTWNLITDGLDLADPSVDFSQFDKDGDGWIDAITFLHSGYGAEWGGTDQYGTYYKDRMWSHKWSIPTWTSAEGVKVSEYNISPGLWGTSGSSPGRIGVVTHELGHFFGLPDLYDTDGSAEGIGNWCLMAGGSWGFDGSQRYPSHLCAWTKIKMGWLMPERIVPGSYSVPRVEDHATIYMIDSGYPPGEYLLIENREPFGFDSVIPQGGLAIWHIDETKGSHGSNNPNTDEGHPWQSGWPANGNHYRVALLQADGSYNLERDHNRGDSGDPFHAAGVSNITGSTTPGTDAYQEGTIIANGNQITGIGSAGASVGMTYGSPLAPTITTGSLANGSPGVSYFDTLTSAGGSAPVSWSEYLMSPWYDEQGLGSSSYSATGAAQGWRADEGIWPLSLPFPFPYFDTVYDTVYVSSNGFIEFAPTEAEPYNEAYTLRASRRIAPLWDDLRTDQTGQDIYVDTGTAGQVKIRWRGETYNGGNDVRFAVVLFEDGRIRFDYGSGNNNASPTVGLSRGEGGAYLLPSGYDGASNLGGADSLMFTLNGSELPEGLSLSSSGVLSGTPTTSGTWNPWFRVTDDDFRYDAIQLPIQIGADCNQNGIDDSDDISSGFSLDCDSNGIPDECELVGNDCNGNGVPDGCDTDCNGNGTPDDCETFTDCNGNSIPDECELDGNDCDSNGVPDECDLDCNGNGTPDACESFTDCNGNAIPDECELVGNDCNTNGVPDECDLDCNGNGTPDDCETFTDCNGNSIPDECELAGNDCNSNGVPDECDVDCNGNGTPDDCETFTDCNGNSIPDECELTGNDCDANGVPDECDLDCNGNGTPDACESFTDCNSNSIPDECELIGNDCNSNGVPDECDVDCNGNGTPDDCESFTDCNGNSIPDECELDGNDCDANGVPDECDPDCNSNGTPDACETFTDCNGNSIPDECELSGNDCNSNGVPDECDVDCNGNGTPDDCESFTDCNGNSIPDECELDGNDCNSNSIPDDCELTGNDCNTNGIPDDCETFSDCNGNSIPDECELAGNDCNSNGVPDECDTDCNSNGTPDDCESFTDCNGNSIPDECELAGNDCNTNGVPDECDLDCNGNGTPDDCETFTDCNGNSIPDECELAGNDCNSNGVPDECDVDCNGNGTPDDCETFTDCNGNSIPDECELAGNDCNSNGVPDECDVDCNGNGTPDDCETFTDCNGNSIPDECELVGNDCNSNGIPDDCDTDCNDNGTPDDCETFADCNGNGIPDECDIADGTSTDHDGDGVPDECSGPGTAYCFGDGNGAPCPCGNTGGAGEGCANSMGQGAALLSAGTAGIAADDLGFNGIGLIPGQSALLFAAANQINGGLGLTFGDGLRCAGGGLVRLGIRVPDVMGDATWNNNLISNGGWSAGETRNFQCWYRDPGGSPCGSDFNLTNAVSVVFTL